MTKPTVRVVRILVYEGSPEFIKASLGDKRAVKGKMSVGDGSITEGFLSGDVGNMTFVEPERDISPWEETWDRRPRGQHPLVGTQVTMKVRHPVPSVHSLAPVKQEGGLAVDDPTETYHYHGHRTVLDPIRRQHQCVYCLQYDGFDKACPGDRSLPSLRKHDLYKDGDADIPQAICDSNGQVCLDLCKACGKAEAELIDHPFCTPVYPADGGRES